MRSKVIPVCWISQYGKQFFEVQIFCYGQAFSGQRYSISYQAPRNLHVVRYSGESNAPLIGQELISKKIFCWRWKTSLNCLAGDIHRGLTGFPIRWKILVLISWNFPRRIEQLFPSLWTNWKGQTAAGRADKELADGEVSEGIFRRDNLARKTQIYGYFLLGITIPFPNIGLNVCFFRKFNMSVYSFSGNRT